MRLRPPHLDRLLRASAHRPRRPGPALAAVAVAVGVTAVVTACGGDDELPAVDAATSPAFEVRATEMSYDPDQVAVQAGEVDVVLHNDGTILHDLRIDGQPFIVEANAGETAAASVALEPGRYRFFCSLPGHREAGMEGVVEVR